SPAPARSGRVRASVRPRPARPPTTQSSIRQPAAIARGDAAPPRSPRKKGEPYETPPSGLGRDRRPRGGQRRLSPPARVVRRDRPRIPLAAAPLLQRARFQRRRGPA